MATMDVLNATGGTETVEKPLTPGRSAAATSRPVALSTEDKALLDMLGVVSGAAVITDATGTLQQYLRGLVVQAAAQLAALTAGNSQLPANLGSKSVAASLATSVKSGGNEYEDVAASQTNQTLGATGAAGDYLECLTCVVSTAATAQVQVKDGAGSAVTIFPNSPGAGVGTYTIPCGWTSTSGAWQITTGAGVAVRASGDFT